MDCLLAQAALVGTLSVRLLGIELAAEQLRMRNGSHPLPPARVTDELWPAREPTGVTSNCLKERSAAG
jgi:hypothetical protein